MAFTLGRNQISPSLVKTGTGSTTPTGGTDDLLTSGDPIKFNIDLARINIRHHSKSFTKRKGISASRFWNIALQFYMQGSGSAGVEAVNGFASIDALFRAAGMTVASPSTTTTYTPSVISALEKCEIWGENDGLLHKAQNCVGNLTMEGRPNDGLICNWSGSGDYAEPTVAAISGFTGGTDRAQAFLGISGTITPSGGSAYSPVIEAFRWNRGIDVRRIPDANSATGIRESFIADANPTMELDIALDKDGSSNLTYDEIYNHLINVTTHAFTFTHGSGTGQAITFTAGQAEMTNFQRRAADGYLAGTISYNLTHATNEGEFSIAIA